MVQSFISKLEDNAVAVRQCKALILDTEDLRSQLQFIETNFRDIPDTIKMLETRGLKLSTALGKFDGLVENLKRIDWSLQGQLQDKINAIIARNPDFEILQQISKSEFTADTLSQFSTLVPYYTFAPITSCDVERSFSRFKDVFTSKRTQFLDENLEKYLIIHSYASNDN